jgi:hypothetical protein
MALVSACHGTPGNVSRSGKAYGGFWGLTQAGKNRSTCNAKGVSKDAPDVSTLVESLEKQPVTPHVTTDASGIHHEPAQQSRAQAAHTHP